MFGLSGEIDEMRGGADLDLLLLEKGWQGSRVHLVEIHQLLEARELGPPAVKRKRALSIMNNLKKIKRMKKNLP